MSSTTPADKTTRFALVANKGHFASNIDFWEGPTPPPPTKTLHPAFGPLGVEKRGQNPGKMASVANIGSSYEGKWAVWANVGQHGPCCLVNWPSNAFYEGAKAMLGRVGSKCPKKAPTPSQNANVGHFARVLGLWARFGPFGAILGARFGRAGALKFVADTDGATAEPRDPGASVAEAPAATQTCEPDARAGSQCCSDLVKFGQIWPKIGQVAVARHYLWL